MELNAQDDAKVINNSMHTFSNDTRSIINVIARRPNWHLQKVREEYNTLYQKDLVQVLDDQYYFNARKVLTALVKLRAETRADEVYEALKGLSTDEQALIDVIIQCSDRQLEETKRIFQQKYQRSMEEWIRADTNFEFKKVLSQVLEAKRSQITQPELMDTDAEIICRAGQGKWGTNENQFLEVLSNRSFEHLQLVNQRFKERKGIDLKDAIENDTSGWYKNALLACITTPVQYWAVRCHQAIEGLGTDDRLLVRCFSEHSKPFLNEVAKEYERIYGVTLLEDIKGDTSGNYRDILTVLLDLPPSERQLYLL